jgi:hypothetical protein
VFGPYFNQGFFARVYFAGPGGGVTPTGWLINIWSGSAWNAVALKVWNGSAWA